MAQTNSWSFPNIFNVSQNQVGIVEDEASIVNRTKLLILTEPTELYNEPTFGVGLRRYLWQYNHDNLKALIRDRVVEQLRLYEPCVVPDNTQYADGLLFTGNGNDFRQDYNQLKMTLLVETTFSTTAEINIEDYTLGGTDE